MTKYKDPLNPDYTHVDLTAHDKRAAKKRQEKREKTRFIAKQLYKQIFPDSTLGCLSGHSGMFERFVKLAEKLENGDLTGTGIGRV